MWYESANGGVGRTHLDETRVGTPAVNHTPFNVSHLTRSSSSEEFVQAASCRTTAILGVLCERYGAPHTVGFHPTGSLLREWVRITEGYVRLVGSSLWMELVEQGTHSSALILSIAKDGRPSTYLGILLFDLGGPSFSDEGCENALEW